MDSMANGRALDATIYLDGNNVHRSVKTGGHGIVGAFQIEVPPGEYEIYAVHDDRKLPALLEPDNDNRAGFEQHVRRRRLSP